MATTSKFWDRMAKRYSRSPIADEASYQHKLEKTREYLTPESRVLEFACGTGSTALLHAQFVKQIDATDYSERMIEIAEEKRAAQGIHNVTFTQLGIQDIQPSETPYDAVMGMSILHLIEDREPVYSKVMDLLKPGGVFISSTACIANMKGLLKSLLPIGGFLGILPKVANLSEDGLKSELTSAGFKIDYAWQPGDGKAIFIVARKP